jgi:hypothetical protein
MFIRFLRQLSVRSRIVGGFVILLVFMTLSVPLIVINHFALTNRVQQLADVEAKADRLLLLALSNVLSSRVNLVRYADDMTSSPSDALNDISQATKLLEEARTLITDPAQKKAANDILAGLASYSNLVVEIQNARIQNRSQDAYILLFNSYQLDFTLDQQIRRVVADSETRIDAANQAALDEAQQRLILLVAGYIILILFAIVITIVVQRSITRPISELRKGAETFRLKKK